MGFVAEGHNYQDYMISHRWEQVQPAVALPPLNSMLNPLIPESSVALPAWSPHSFNGEVSTPLGWCSHCQLVLVVEDLPNNLSNPIVYKGLRTIRF